MKVLFLRGVGTLALFSLLGSMLSCAHDQQLVSVSVTPGEEIIGDANTPVIFDAGASVQLRALGHYIHPQVTKDITNQVTWGSDDIQMVTVNPTGLVMATGNACGATLISATVNTNSSAGNRTSKGAIVTGYMTTDVTCFTGTKAKEIVRILFCLERKTGMILWEQKRPAPQPARHHRLESSNGVRFSPRQAIQTNCAGPARHRRVRTSLRGSGRDRPSRRE